jgi:hypothetical protein
MGTRSRLVAIGTLAAIGLVWAEQGALASQAESGLAAGAGGVKRPVATRSQIRTASEILATLIREGSERSQTFRALVAAIEATDGLVYLTAGRCGRLRACFLHQITAAGPDRVLNIVVNAQNDDLRFIAPIAHELQHALEVLGDSRITTDTAIKAFYMRNGFETRGVIETRAAVAAGDAVRNEVRRSLRAAQAR